MNKKTKRAEPVFELRKANQEDCLFAESLYVETMKPLLMRINAWDEEDLIAKFKQSFMLEQVRIIRVGETDAGWMQTAEASDEINLSQIHLLEGFRSLGIGSRLIQDLLDQARAKKKSVSLAVVHNNRATALYRRFGFKEVARDREKLHMLWHHADPDGSR